MSLEVLATCWRSIVSHAEHTYPEEACGAVLGHRTEMGAVGIQSIGMRNIAPDRHKFYQFDPEEMEDVELTARRRGMKVLAYYTRTRTPRRR
jgi:proteasome lid subunit RPN8/RPN11